MVGYAVSGWISPTSQWNSLRRGNRVAFLTKWSRQRGNKSALWISVRASIIWQILCIFSEWRNCKRAQRKVNLCAPGVSKGPKVGMFVRQYEILCANDAGHAPRKYPVMCANQHKFWAKGGESLDLHEQESIREPPVSLSFSYNFTYLFWTLTQELKCKEKINISYSCEGGRDIH